MSMSHPLWLENSAEHHAVDYRLELADRVSPGVASVGALRVTEAPGTPDMSVRVQAGGAYIASTRSELQGTYYTRVLGAQTVVVPAADATNDRIDLVCVHIRDSAQDVTLDDTATVELVAGTPAAVPQRPAIPFEDYLVLAEILVPASADAVTDQDITDERVRAMSRLAGPRVFSAPIIGGATIDDNELTLATVPIPAQPVDSLINVVAVWSSTASAAGDVYRMRVRVDGAQVVSSSWRAPESLARAAHVVPGVPRTVILAGQPAEVAFTVQRAAGTGVMSAVSDEHMLRAEVWPVVQ